MSKSSKFANKKECKTRKADGIRRRWCKSSRPIMSGRSWVYPSAQGESIAAPFI